MNSKAKSYLFLAVPNYSGSTLLHNLLGLSSNVVSLPKNTEDYPYIVEGALYGKANFFIHRMVHLSAVVEDYARDIKNYQAENIRKAAMDYAWDNIDPSGQKIRLQKTPNDIFRLADIHKFYEDLKWILMVRNPYSYAGSYLKRPQFDDFKIEIICQHIGRITEIQIENEALLGNKSCSITYEALVNDQQNTLDKISSFLPALGQLSKQDKIGVKNTIDDIKEQPFEMDVATINTLTQNFRKYEKAFNYWGYELK